MEHFEAVNEEIANFMHSRSFFETLERELNEARVQFGHDVKILEQMKKVEHHKLDVKQRRVTIKLKSIIKYL